MLRTYVMPLRELVPTELVKTLIVKTVKIEYLRRPI